MKFKLRRYYLYYLGRVFAFIVYLIPLRVGLWIAGLLGTAAFHLSGKYGRITIENLRAAFGSEKTEGEIRAIAMKVFQNIAKNAVEMVNFPKINASNLDRFVRMENAQILDEGYRKGKGILVLTAHIGNWELMALTLRVKGYPGVTIGKKIYFHKYDRYLNMLRRVHDVNVIYRDESPKNMLKVLKKNWIVGIVADQDIDSIDGVFVNFFGRPAYTPAGPVVLARVSGAALIPVFIVRENGRHVLKVEKPIELADTGDKEKDVINNTQKWSDVIELFVKRYPDQWVWMHRRWKTKKGIK